MDAMETKLFRKLDDDEKNDEFIAVESRTFLQSVWHDFTGNKRAVAGAIILIIVVLMAIFGPMMCKYSYAEQNMSLRNASPSMDHWFGTDRMGRDIFVRILFGARISLAVGCLAAVINLIVGTIYGGIAGYVGGKVDMVMMRIVDIIYSVPAMLYIVLIMLIFGASVISIMLGISITCWIDMARIVRQQVKSLKEHGSVCVRCKPKSYPDQTFADQYDGTDHCYGNFDGAAGNLYRGLAEFLRCRHFRTDGKLGYFSTGCKTVDHDISDADGISNDCNLYHDLLVQLRW